MVTPGTDVRIVLEPAPVVGAAIALGVGGAHPAALAPLAGAVLPLSDRTAADLVTRSGLAGVLDGKGAAAVAELLLRVSLLAEEVPELERLVLNPVIVSEGTAWVIDIDAHVTPEPDLPPDDLRRLGD
jgi:hypothetical protein